MIGSSLWSNSSSALSSSNLTQTDMTNLQSLLAKLGLHGTPTSAQPLGNLIVQNTTGTTSPMAFHTVHSGPGSTYASYYIPTVFSGPPQAQASSYSPAHSGLYQPAQYASQSYSLVQYFSQSNNPSQPGQVPQPGQVDVTFSRYKARLVANGSTQIDGVDVDETISQVVKPCTIRTVLSLATSPHWLVHQLDVKNAFLHGDLAETVYMHQPLGFQDSTHPDYRIIASLHQEFSMRDQGPLNYFLGGCNSIRTPVDTYSKLGDDDDPIFDPKLYRSLAGSLQYLTFTCPDISYAMQQICLYMHDPREPHFSALKRILRYVRGTLDYGLQLFSSSTTSLVAYSNADWAGCPTTRRSTSGYYVFLGNNLLSWSSKRQPTLSRSSAEAEYYGVANVVAKTCWLRNLLHELHTPLSSAMLVYCDNVSDVYLSSNPVQHQRTKHIEIDIHFVHDLVAAGQVRVLHVSSRYPYADIFTKGLPSTLFEEFRTSLSVRCPPAPTAGECSSYYLVILLLLGSSLCSR
ncbi:ribonuclease H-like domain-containing protein [Tanacetum coccineum]